MLRGGDEGRDETKQNETRRQNETEHVRYLFACVAISLRQSAGRETRVSRKHFERQASFRPGRGEAFVRTFQTYLNLSRLIVSGPERRRKRVAAEERQFSSSSSGGGKLRTVTGRLPRSVVASWSGRLRSRQVVPVELAASSSPRQVGKEKAHVSHIAQFSPGATRSRSGSTGKRGCGGEERRCAVLPS